jgi:hypothetical protein
MWTFGSYEPFWGEFHVYGGVGRALVIDETLILVAGVIRVFVLATDAGGAWYPCAGVAVGDEEESSRACGWGMGRGRGLERAHRRSFVIGRRRCAGAVGRDRDMSHDLSRISEPDVASLSFISVGFERKGRSSLEVVDALSDRSFPVLCGRVGGDVSRAALQAG